jgi:hypothetical protein
MPAPEPFQDFRPAPSLSDNPEQVEIEYGIKGSWNKIHVPRDVQEEQLNDIISGVTGLHAATTDFTGGPVEGQQYRFFPDVSHGPPIWITLRQGTKRSNLPMVMRVSTNSTQVEIEQAASEYWAASLEFKNFPKTFDATVTYWMHPHRDEESEAEQTFPEPETLDSIPHVPTPMVKPATCTFVRSLSSDDLKSSALDHTLQKSADTQAHWTVVFGLQHVMYWAPEDAPEEVVIARAAESVGLRPKGWDWRRGDHWRIYCTDPFNVPEASIHFGSLKWYGKVEPSFSVDQLICAAQSQLEIPGTWKVRNHYWEENVQHIECEQIESEEVYPIYYSNVRRSQKIFKFLNEYSI